MSGNRSGYNIGREDNTPRGEETPYKANALGGGNTYSSASNDLTHQPDSIKVHNEKTLEYIKEVSGRTGKTVAELLKGLETHN